MKKRFIRQILKTLFFLTVLTIVCGFLVRTLTNSETLSDYAAKNPELAYGKPIENPQNSEVPQNNELPQNSEETVPAEPNQPSDGNVENNVAVSPDRIIYQEGFYYEPLSDEIKAIITGISYPASESENVAFYDSLRYLSVLYYDFDGNVQAGELICNKGIVKDLADIFYELYLNEYPIEKIRLIDEYQGDDELSMQDNNTYCFCYRVISGTSTLSNHASGCAIDINPFYNPYVVINKTGETTSIHPAGSSAYADRSMSFAHKIDENDLCYQLFKEHGFEWGGSWKGNKDYQHFQKVVK